MNLLKSILSLAWGLVRATALVAAGLALAAARILAALVWRYL